VVKELPTGARIFGGSWDLGSKGGSGSGWFCGVLLKRLACFETHVRVGGKLMGANLLGYGLASSLLFLGHVAGRYIEARSMRTVTGHGRGEKESGPGDIGKVQLKALGSFVQVNI
jgi:hypothetical protein